MTTVIPQNLSERLAKLDADQIVRLVTGLQQRIDDLRARNAAQPAIRQPVAIVGLACRFPGAPDAAAFATLLNDGRDAIGAPPAGRPEGESLPAGGYIDGIDRFDADFFGIRAGEAASMDPQHRLILEVAWHALEDAGAADAQRRPPGTGVFLGISTHDYEARFHSRSGHGLTPQAATGNAASTAAGRLAHLLNVTGPALAIDTACSSSLVAVLAACRSLQSDDCGMALAGGVNLLVTDEWTRGFAAAGMLSQSRACRTFDAAADGYVRGEGAGFIVLKRLADAERDGDRVRAVIRGGAVNHDGRASSLTAPNAAAQVALIRAALADSGLGPAEVGMVECHGTGTPLGDPIEVQALAEAYGAARTAPLLLGAVKTNIGHLEAAAGIAGLIKTVLALESGRLPPTLHQTTPNPRIAWERLPVRVIDRPQAWPAGAALRRAGVSGFGFSGTNAHILLEEAGPCAAATPGGGPVGPVVLPLSAPDAAGLNRLAAGLAGWIEAMPGDAGRAAASLAIGRGRFAERAAVVAEDAAGLAAGLRAVAAGGASAPGGRGTAPSTPPKIAFLFTGQGSQWAGMGRDLYDADPVFRAVVDRCARVVDPLIGEPLAALIGAPDAEERLSDTRLAQPALFVLGYALAERLAGWGILPDIVLGHSLGEWIAACRAGVFALDDALRLVVERGRLMAGASPDGAMAAVFAPSSVLSQLPSDLRESIDVAAINAADEFVVSGPAAAVEAACRTFDRGGIGTQRLRTRHAFHSRLMDPALEAFAAALEGVPLARPAIPILSNLTGGADGPFDSPSYWVRQLREPVRFADGVSALADAGVTLLIEVGASPVLTGMVGRAAAFQGRPVALVPTLRRNQPARRTLGTLLAQLFVAGAPIRWDAVFDPRTRIDVPGYPFADRRHWVASPAIPVATPATIPAAAPPAPRSVPGRPAPGHTVPAAGTEPPGDLRAEVSAVLARSLQLNLADIGSDRGFLELGVDSLALTEAAAALERRWGIAIPRRALFESLGTPNRLIAYVTATHAGTTRPGPSDAKPVQAEAAAQSPEAADSLEAFSRLYIQRSRASRAERERYGARLADSRAVAGYRPATKALLYPIVGARGMGSRLTDADGNEYVDIAMGFGVQLFGHNPPFVTDALARQLAGDGLFLGPQAPLAGEVAERLCRLTGTARAAFCNSGTEAVMTALRLARHATGRRRIAMFQGSYHGHFDGTLAQAGPGGAGIPLASGTPPGMLEDVLMLDYGDEDGAIEALTREGETLAAVIVEPVQGRRPDRQPRAFLQRLRALTLGTGAALIFDEVLLGFRAALGGAQAWSGVRADLVTYGKIVGGGLPIGIVAGDARYLDALDGGAWPLDGPGGPKDERTFFAGTFNKNPLTMVAARAVLDRLEAAGPALQDTLNRRTDAFAARLNAVLADADTGIAVHHFASLFRFVGAGDLFFNHLIQNGVYVWEGRTCFLSTAHDDQDLDRVEEAVRAALRAMRAGGLMAPARRPAVPSPALPAVTAPERVPTTPGQSALRLLAAFSPQASAAYNQSLVFDFAGPLDPDALHAALHAVVARHEALRTTFPEDGASQLIHPRLDPAVRVSDHEGADDAAVHAWMDDAILTPMDLENGPTLAAWILRLGRERHRLLLVMPHLVTDGWSMQVIAGELAELYNARREGRAPELPAPVPYRLYAAHARSRADDPAEAAYWRSLYATVPAALDLPADRPRPAIQTFAGARALRRLPRRLRDALEAKARRSGVSLFSLCLAAYGRLLARLSGRDEVVVAIFSAGQPELAAAALVGYCVAVLPLRISAGSATPDDQLSANVQRAVADGMAHRNHPFARLLKDLNIRRDPARPPLAAVSFNLDRLEPVPVFYGLTATMEGNAHGAVRWDLNWNLQSDADGLGLDVHYNRDLFERTRVEGWLDAYTDILEALAGGTPACGGDAPAAPAVETLASRVARWAGATPTAPAVRDRQGTIDYAGLDARAAALAEQLEGAGIRPGDRVAFRLERGLGPVVAMLALGRLGAAFVPLDTAHPDSHHARVLDDSGARALVVEPGSPPPSAAIPVIPWRRDATSNSRRAATGPVAPDDLAYVLYTSGSTGQPKGVRVSCGSVDAYATAMLERLAVDGPTSFAIVSSFAADLGYTAILGALWSGGALHAVDAETARDPAALQRWMGETPVDALKIVPAHLSALLDAPDGQALLPRKALILGGDVLPWGLVDRVRALGANCRVFNHYGPTETTVGACMTEAAASLREDGAVAVPIGRPLHGYAVSLVDEAGRPVPMGQEGEIVIAGPAVALGYTRPEPPGQERFGRTAEGSRFYRTGDLGRLRPDGAVVFLGRRDDMVKIGGHRIEPAGMAELLRSHPGVRDAVVLVERPEGREPSMLAAVAGDADPPGLRAWLAQRVPPAMVPGRILVRPAFPLTANGKIDRQALLADAEPAAGGARPSADPAPAGAAAGDDGDGRIALLRGLWGAVLQRPDIGADDDFFTLGGDSISAIQIVGRARAAGLGLTPTQVFEAPTPRGLARLAVPVGQAVVGVAPCAEPVPLTPIQRWFLETPMPNRRRWCLTAVFEAPAALTVERLRAVVEAIVARHDALRIRLDARADHPVQAVGPAVSPTVVAVDGMAPDGRALDEACLREAEDRLADRLMDRIDPAAGRILAAGAILPAGAGRTRIVVAVHHAVFDMVSWSILADDLQAGLTGGPAAIRPASTAWSWWAQALARQAGQAGHLAYWRDVAERAQDAVVLPADRPAAPNREGDVQERRLLLDPGRSARFLAGLSAVFGLRPHEAILAAVGRGLTRWAGSPLAVDLEGHGREPFDAAIDLSRTIGWFTTRYPVVLPPADAESDCGWLVAMKEMVRRIPGNGIGYGLLRYGAEAPMRTEPAVSFNFIGELGQYGQRGLDLVRFGAGRERDGDAERRHLLTFDGWLDKGGVCLSCRFAARHDAATIEAVLRRIDDEVTGLTAAGAAFPTAVYTPSDFTAIDFSQDELDRLVEEIAG